MEFPHEMRDPIHGLIRLTDQEMRIVNTQTFQRLRRIRQLAMADLVYPGALHTRFEHSLGTLATAQKILSHLDTAEHMSDTDVRIVRLSALLHDIGHGPFSHVSEYLLERFYDRDAVAEASSREKIHERVTVDIVNNVHDVADLLTPEDQSAVSEIISGSRLRDYRRDIVSSSLDADKMDYLLRDAHYSGVRYGLFDLEKVVDTCRRYTRGEESYLAIDEAGLFAVEQLVIAKHYMTQQVYAHRVRTVTDLMIVRGLHLGIEDGVPELVGLYSYDGSIKFLERYLSYDDGSLVHALLRCEQDRPKAVFERLFYRHLFKELTLIPLDDRTVNDSIALGHLLNLDSETITDLEELIAAELGCHEWEVIVHKKSIKNPVYQAPGGLDPEAIHVISRDGVIRAMSQFPDLLDARMPSTERLHVVGPLDLPSSIGREERRKIRAEHESRIKQIVFERVRGTS